MKLHHQIAGGLIVICSLGAVGTLGAGTASAATAREGANRPGKQSVCANPEEAATKLQTRIDKLTEGLAKLADRRAAALESGNDRAVTRLDRLSARLDTRRSKAEQHLDGLPGWIAENC